MNSLTGFGASSVGYHSHKLCCLTAKESNQTNCAYQKGVVLFFALIALVVMSLAAVALIRSVDTNTLIAGNLAFKQSATASADAGLETALNWLDTHQSDLDADKASSGYYAAPAEKLDSSKSAKSRFDNGFSLATGVGLNSGKDGSGNTIAYVVERMCVPGTNLTPLIGKAEDKCLVGAATTFPDGKGIKDVPEAGGPPSSLGASPLYRVTVRVVGPKNTLSYTQAFVY